MSEKKNCIAVLTRGYNELIQYDKLIKRNNHIDKNLKDKSIDILIFHEGNIVEKHQIFIKDQTPLLKIQFIDISTIAFQSDKKDIPFDKETSDFSLGYRHMCSFWFIQFFDAVKEYDKLVRIDEDCFIDSNIDDIFIELDKYTFICGILSGDEKFVTKGLNDFSIDFINRYNKDYSFKTMSRKDPDGPYTNLIGFSLDLVRKNTLFQKYINEVDSSNMIYKRRWGDLPLWGEVIQYIFGKDTLKVDNTIKYYHGSHSMYVNP